MTHWNVRFIFKFYAHKQKLKINVKQEGIPEG